MIALFTITSLLAWAAPILAQDDAQTCSFALSSDGSLLGQVDSGQVVGIPSTHDSSAGDSGTIFHLRGGGLYDAAMRGCWWPEPSTVLVCSLLPPAYPDPFFALDSDGHLVYNTSRRDFWACPANLGGDGKRNSYYYYLDPPADMPRDGGGKLCKKVTLDGGVLNGFRCNNVPGSSSSSSSSSSSRSPTSFSRSPTSSSSSSSSRPATSSSKSHTSSSSASSSPSSPLSSSSSSKKGEVSETLAMSCGQFSWTETVVSIETTDGWDWLGEPTTTATALGDVVVVTVTSTVPESMMTVTVTRKKPGTTTTEVVL